MKNHEAEALFKESERLYRERRYEEALEVLKHLDERYPDTRNILYPIAKCFRRLGRFDEAAAVCDRLVLEFDDQKAKHMRQSIQHALDRSAANTIQVAAGLQANIDEEIDPGFDGLDLAGLPPLDEEAETIHIPGGYGANSPMRQTGSNIPWLYIGVGVVVVVALVIVIAAISGGNDSGGSAAEAAPVQQAQGVDETQLTINMYMYWGFATLFIYWVALYVTLMISDKLPYVSFGDNALSVFGFSFLCAAVGMIPCFGLIINIVILRKRYEMTFINFLALIGISTVASFPFLILFFVLFWNSFVELAEAQQATTY